MTTRRPRRRSPGRLLSAEELQTLDATALGTHLAHLTEEEFWHQADIHAAATRRPSWKAVWSWAAKCLEGDRTS